MPKPPNRGALIAAALCIAAFAPVASAAERLLALRSPPPLGQDIAAMPRIADPADVAERRINAALRAIDARLRADIARCKDDQGRPGEWARSVSVAMGGPRYLSLFVTDNPCHFDVRPDRDDWAIVFDLKSGSPVDWTRLLPPALAGKIEARDERSGVGIVTLASARLFALYLKQYRKSDVGADPQCLAAVTSAGESAPPAMSVWLDAKAGGLGAMLDLTVSGVVACEEEMVIPAASLPAVRVARALVRAIEDAHARWKDEPAKR